MKVFGHIIDTVENDVKYAKINARIINFTVDDYRKNHSPVLKKIRNSTPLILHSIKNSRLFFALLLLIIYIYVVSKQNPCGERR